MRETEKKKIKFEAPHSTKKRILQSGNSGKYHKTALFWTTHPIYVKEFDKTENVKDKGAESQLSPITFRKTNPQPRSFKQTNKQT